MCGLKRVSLLLPAALAALALLGGAGATATRSQSLHAASPSDASVEVVVTLPQPSLAEAARRDRALAAATTTRRRRLSLRAPASVSYLRTLASAQRTLQARIARTIPGAAVRWRYGVVLNGLAVSLPRSELGRLRAIPGATIWPSLTYHALLDRSPQLIGAPALWGPTLATAGEGMKIGIIDDGIDQTHPFFDPVGYAYPPGFPKGQTAFTTPKVIVARAFSPASNTWKYANRPFDPQLSDHATHVAGIAAGNNGTPARSPDGTRTVVSGIAPKAYLGNYKVLTVPTQQFGLDGNSPEIAAAIEQAVKDGMDVINLSLGEPEIAPSRDIVVQAIDAAADAGVVPAIAAGNDFDVAGRGSVGSPGTAPNAITAAASTSGRDELPDVIATFSSSGPTPVSLQMKPDVTAPGKGILSSVPPGEGSWAVFDGTSMASPHVAGAAALLRQRHPTWTVEQIKSALETTGDPVKGLGALNETVTTREGGGRIDLVRADNPLVFTDPTGLSFGLVRRGATVSRSFAVGDAGGGPDPWQVSVQQQTPQAGVTFTATPAVAAPGAVSLTVAVGAAAREADLTGFVVLTRGADVRRVPYWLRVEAPKLATEKHLALSRPGVYQGNTRGRPSRVDSYRYPEGGPSPGIPTRLIGPEQVFRYTLKRPVANFGVAVTARAPGVRVSPRLVFAGDENRLVGYTGLPANLNPYANYGVLEPVVGAVLPTPGAYDIVFDTPNPGQAGRFTFRFWLNDVTPPSVRVVGATAAGLVVAVTDRGSGVDPSSLAAIVDGRPRPVHWRPGRATVATGRLAPGLHRLAFRASDYQEAKNMEDVGPVLPNTRTLRTSFRIRGGTAG